jgi:hypothetical protein
MDKLKNCHSLLNIIFYFFLFNSTKSINLENIFLSVKLILAINIWLKNREKFWQMIKIVIQFKFEEMNIY